MLTKPSGEEEKRDNLQDPNIHFGRYSDNNKSVEKVNRWADADNLFKEGKYMESMDAFFEYLRDDSAGNVMYERNGSNGRFDFYQGSKMVRGVFDEHHFKAEVILARMPQPSVQVMRSLLDKNFNLFYNRFALYNEQLFMRFDSDIAGASPSKLYYALKELATKADKEHDRLLDYIILETIDSEHISPVPQKEKEIKYEYLQKWLKQTLDTVESLDPDKFSGGIAYMLLALIYRIDYLLAPEGKLIDDLEKTAGIYFKKDDRSVIDKNRDIVDDLKKLQARGKEEIFSYFFRSRYTFSIVAPQQHKKVTETIENTNTNTTWYRQNNYPFIASQVAEYGVSYCQYSYSLPRPVRELIHLYMMIGYPDYFKALGYHTQYYDPKTNELDSENIIKRIKEIQDMWKGKYVKMDFNIKNLQFDSLANFAHTFATELGQLKMDDK